MASLLFGKLKFYFLNCKSCPYISEDTIRSGRYVRFGYFFRLFSVIPLRCLVDYAINEAVQAFALIIGMGFDFVAFALLFL